MGGEVDRSIEIVAGQTCIQSPGQRKIRLDTAHLRLGKQKQIIHGDASSRRQ
jgi:hypothetical protein